MICNYQFEIPQIGTCCNAYAESERKDGLHWSHYPECKERNCPLKHPELLEGAKLKNK